MKKNLKTAYSLIELSIVIVIISILITGALTVSVGSINNAKVKTTNDRLEQLGKALGNYLLANKKLPCPASLAKVKTSDSDYGAVVGSDGDCTGSGIYQSASSTNLVYGMVPVRALGLSNDLAEDGFETKIVYIVDKNFTSTSTFGTATYTSIITIKERPGGVDQTVTNDAIFALVSYGANKSGGFNANSSTQVARSSDTEELDNDLNTSSPYFNNMLYLSSGNSDVFDDIVSYKTRNAIVGDVSAFSLIPCAAYNPSDVTYGVTNIVWPAGAYNEIVVATTSCPSGYTSGVTKPTKRCGAYGSWQAGVVNPCLAP